MNENNKQPNLIPAEEVQNCEAWQMPVLEAVGEPVSVGLFVIFIHGVAT